MFRLHTYMRDHRAVPVGKRSHLITILLILGRSVMADIHGEFQAFLQKVQNVWSAATGSIVVWLLSCMLPINEASYGDLKVLPQAVFGSFYVLLSCSMMRISFISTLAVSGPTGSCAELCSLRVQNSRTLGFCVKVTIPINHMVSYLNREALVLVSLRGFPLPGRSANSLLSMFPLHWASMSFPTPLLLLLLPLLLPVLLVL